MPKSPPATGIPRGDQRWATFLKNHARGTIACDFCVAVTATFRILYVFVVIEHASRRQIHLNVTAHPTAGWTLQQLRDAIPFDHDLRHLRGAASHRRLRSTASAVIGDSPREPSSRS